MGGEDIIISPRCTCLYLSNPGIDHSYEAALVKCVIPIAEAEGARLVILVMDAAGEIVDLPFLLRLKAFHPFLRHSAESIHACRQQGSVALPLHLNCSERICFAVCEHLQILQDTRCKEAQAVEYVDKV